MIPPDIISRLQLAADPSLRPITPVRDATDRFTGLASGQRVIAEILSLLPNGSYRALINQRDVTLALPFSAKSGDSIELVVTQSNGKQVFTVLAYQEAGQAANTSTATVLSRTGQFISSLFSASKGEQQGKAEALPLNNNQPILETPLKNAPQIIPQLKEALSKSGMFYEAHQAAWLAGKLSKEALLQEPQGKLSALANALLAPLVDKQGDPSKGVSPTLPQMPSNAAQNKPESVSSILKDLAAILLKDNTTPAPKVEMPNNAATALAAENGQTLKKGTETAAHQMLTQSASANTGGGSIIAPQTQSMVQQQLASLASQHFAWQGQIWPGQDMHWEIEEGREEKGSSGENGDTEATSWQTRLYLKLPQLGGIDARISIQGEQIALQIFTDNNQSLERMRQDSGRLRLQFTEAGLDLSSVGLNYIVEAATEGKAEQTGHAEAPSATDAELKDKS